jgi:hypothetical protein
MRFWPFGKDKDAGDVEFASRIVAGKARDGAMVRGKLTLHFSTPRARDRADELADRGASALMDRFEAARSAADLIGDEESLATTVRERLASDDVRSAEVVALHVVGEPSQDPSSRRHSSRPPPNPPRRAGSSQSLAARDSRLIPEGASPEVVGDALVPLIRDATTRTLVGVLRAYDLLILRHVEIDPRSSEDFGELVPVSAAAPGRFEEDRASELGRWEGKLGADKLDHLRGEAATVVCHFLHANLSGSGLDAKIAADILAQAAKGAFADRTPLAELPRYLHASSEAGPAGVLADRVLAELGVSEKLTDGFGPAITPILQALQNDFSFVAQQVLFSGVRRS